jgi:Holliday junction resolvase
MKNEKDVKKKVKALLDTHGWFWFMPPANAYGKSGIADIIAIKDGVFLAIETKFGPNKPTPLQVGFLNSIRKEHGIAFVVNDKTVSFFEQWLEAFTRATTAVAGQKMPETEDGSLMLNAIKVLTDAL